MEAINPLRLGARRQVATRPGNPRPPIARFLAEWHAQFSGDRNGAIADYIPELSKADPDHFGISLATTLFFLQSGMVGVKLPSGVRLATLGPGTAFGETALIEGPRTADVWADTAVACLELPIDRYVELRERNPEIGERITRNLAVLLASRLDQANVRIDVLTA